VHFKYEVPGPVRRTEGCGTKKGLRLIIDSQDFFSGSKGHGHKSNGFLIFITRQGAVSQTVHFHIHPEYEGEYFFYMHNLQKVVASDEFCEWNKDEKVIFILFKLLTFILSVSYYVKSLILNTARKK
jgi:hypothetical protein